MILMVWWMFLLLVWVLVEWLLVLGRFLRWLSLVFR